jgi:hypothetical protein
MDGHDLPLGQDQLLRETSRRLPKVRLQSGRRQGSRSFEGSQPRRRRLLKLSKITWLDVCKLG